ncbi:hypothetical protein [Chryseobacterium sp. KMC2]|uniref:hypothetical protein n=1 Tax=Chryseobacterium sp. KMC2 TaxID=2800705 RepID=UPI0019208D20|nr:hypothetical protein [Chryseobacterium sp. KMC2]MBL3550437.1 hypothetical protein [Chryseobacterium sp. KMC2]
MKKIIFITCLSLVVFSCMSQEEKFKKDIENSIISYNNNLVDELDAEVKNFKIKYIDSLNSSKEKEILLNYLIDEHSIIGAQKNEAYQDLHIKDNSLRLSQQLSQKYPSYQNIVERDRLNYSKSSQDFNSLQYDEKILFNSIQKIKSEITKEAKNKSILAYRVMSDYDVKSKNESTHHVKKIFILSLNKDVFDEENYVSNLRSKYLK